MRLKTSTSESTATNGPRKQIGGGNCAHNAANAGGCGNVPPAIGCSPGYGFDFGLYGIICEKSGRGSWHTTSSFSATDCFENNPVSCNRFINTKSIEIQSKCFVPVAKIVKFTGEYPIDFNSTPVHGNKSKNLYRSTSCAVSLPSNSLS